MPEPLVLDTHAWIWLIMGAPMSPRAMLAIQAAAVHEAIWVPAIAVWELGMLVAKGRLTLDRSVETWVASALQAPGLQLAGLDPAVALASTMLPGDFHGDPADRMMVATTRIRGGTLVTRDDKILSYGRAGHLRVIKA